MKKILSILLCCSFLLVGCGGGDSTKKEDSLANPKEEQVIEDVLSFTIESIESNKTIDPPILSGYYTYYYKVNNSANTFLDVIISVKNLSEESISPTSLLKSTFTIDEKDITAGYIVVSEDGSSVSTSRTIEPEQEVIMHIYAEVSEIPDTFTLAIKIDEVEKKFKIDVASFESTKNYKNYGDSIISEGYTTISIQEAVSTKLIEPTDPSSLYYYYKVEEDANSFVGLKLKVRNDSAEEISLGKLLGFRTIFSDEVYSGYTIVEYPSGSNLSTSYTLLAGEETTVYLVAEIPDEVATNPGEYRIYFQGEYYYINK